MSELAKELVIYHRESAARLNTDTSSTYKSQVDAHNKTADLIEQLQQRNAELEMHLDAALELIGQVYSSGINLNELEEPIHEFLVNRRF